MPASTLSTGLESLTPVDQDFFFSTVPILILQLLVVLVVRLHHSFLHGFGLLPNQFAFVIVGPPVFFLIDLFAMYLSLVILP